MMKLDEFHNIPSFQTADLSLACALVSHGFEITRFDTTSPSRVVFCFSSSKELSKAVNDFWTGTLSVEPKMYWNVQRELKARIRNEQERGQE